MRVPVLDFGYVELIEHWGSDERIIEAARVSTNKGFRGWGTPENRGDERLLAYLYRHKHFTPFEMGGFTIEVSAPIFVFRQWMKHRTQSYNEMSARYVPLPCENYFPSIERLMSPSGESHQSHTIKNADVLTEESALEWLDWLDRFYNECEILYQHGLQIGLPKEVARIVLPVGRYSRMRASTDLRNWMSFLILRLSSDAQWEIQQYAQVIFTIIKDKFPRTWGLLRETLSNQGQ